MTVTGQAPDRWVADAPPAARPLVIGLVNSMPGEARRHTEQQFRGILAAAAVRAGVAVELRLYVLGGTYDGDRPPGYADSARVAFEAPDGLIVTGMPPRAASLRDEPYWDGFADLVDTAVQDAVPTMWSCLAAHAAVLHCDGIERRRLAEKLSGVFDCARADSAHPATAGLPQRWRVPHSRYNELPEGVLVARGYRILSRSIEGGVDMFASQGRAPFLFCQGHPEYDAQTLLREYRRDVRQFLAGERNEYPRPPHGCFGAEVRALLAAFEAQARHERQIGLLEAFPSAACAADLDHAWGGLAVGLYSNWLALVLAQSRAEPDRVPVAALGTAAE